MTKPIQPALEVDKNQSLSPSGFLGPKKLGRDLKDDFSTLTLNELRGLKSPHRQRCVSNKNSRVLPLFQLIEPHSKGN
jgi:hypothetical protein